MKHQQLVYLDESGDAGFKLQLGSSPVLLVAATIFDSTRDAEVTAERIQLLRRALGKGDSFQFHFASLRRGWREDFLGEVAQSPFRVRAIVMPKGRIQDHPLRSSPKDFYNFTVKTLLTRASGSVRDAKVFIDGSSKQAPRAELGAYLRRECNTQELRIIDELKSGPKSNVLIQLADMVASGLALSYRPAKTDAGVYRKILLPRIEDVWEYEGTDQG
jgi:hypothetical protein